MLTEHFVASISAPIKGANASGFKDIGIFLHELQPLAGQRQVFKRSATAPNCLAVSETHIFAAQAEKAVVHVYNREKANHEATIPFNEKITSIVLAAANSILILGTEGGRVMAWELTTGRLTSTAHSHLQAITVLALDPTSNWLLSGSRDSTVHVWSLSALLSFSAADPSGQSNGKSPVHSLSNHRGPITALAVGHGHGQANIAISGSEDQSAVIWDYKTGSALATYLLRGLPTTLVLDTADRGFYTAYEDASIQLVDLYADVSSVNNIHSENIAPAAVQPGDRHLWTAEGQELGECSSLAVSWDGSRLISGHKSGKIASWDTAKGSFVALLDTLPGSITNLTMLPIGGLPQSSDQAFRIVEIVKPKITTSDAVGVVPAEYSFSAQLTSRRDNSRSRKSKTLSFQDALAHPSFPTEVLEAGAAALLHGGKATVDHDDGFVSVAEDKTSKELAELKAQNQLLLEQAARLQKLQKASFAQIREKTRIIESLVDEQRNLAEIAKKDHGWEITDMNIEWDLYQQRLRNGTHLSANGVGNKANGVGKNNEAEEEESEDEDEEMEDDTSDEG